MKNLILCAFFVCFCFKIEAQVNRSIGQSQYRNHGSAAAKKDKKDPIDISVEYLSKELNLDDFQIPACRIFLEEHSKENSKIMATNSISDGEKTLRIQKVNETLDSNIKSILTPTQLEIFENLKNKKESKKSKKKSKNKKESSNAVED
jgi:acid phosphatase class B